MLRPGAEDALVDTKTGLLDFREPRFLRLECPVIGLTLPMLRLLSSKHKDTQIFVENYLNHVMLVFIG